MHSQGQFAVSMGAFLSWIAGRYEELQQRLHTRVRETRSQGRGREVHARLPANLAELQSGWELFLEFALEAGGVSVIERDELVTRSERAFNQLAVLQAKYQKTSDPASRFVALLKAAMACGRAHVADRSGKAPEDAAVWGWQRPVGRRWAPEGVRIGWVAGQDVYLKPQASYQIAQELAGAERMAVSEQTLRQRLRQRGLLASMDRGRGMIQVRRTLEGIPRQVLHLNASDLVDLGAEVIARADRGRR